MAANDSVRVRVMDLVTKLLEYVRDEKRDANDVARVLQVVKDNPNFIQQFFPEEARKPELLTRNRRARHLLDQWYSIYTKEFGMKLDPQEFRAIRIPPHKQGFDRLIVVLEGLTLNQIIAVLKKHMAVWIYTDNLNSITSVRKTNKTYAIWVRDRQEADEELKNKSANQLQQEGINGITLEERLLLELKYRGELGLHLDINNVTECSGSRDPNGFVPSVDWDPSSRKLRVNWFDPEYSNAHLRARQAVSCGPEIVLGSYQKTDRACRVLG